MTKNIVLIGFMGTGKTVVGRCLATKLKCKFVDTDTEIENVTGKTINQIFARDGVIRFRSEEDLLVQKIYRQPGLVIATGGGLVLNQENARLLQSTGTLICLTATPEVIYQRVKGKKCRPLLLKGDLMENIENLLAERADVYRVAELTIDGGDKSPEEITEIIITYLKERELL